MRRSSLRSAVTRISSRSWPKATPAGDAIANAIATTIHGCSLPADSRTGVLARASQLPLRGAELNIPSLPYG